MSREGWGERCWVNITPEVFFLPLRYRLAESDQLLWELPTLLFLTAPAAPCLDQTLHSMHLLPNSILCCLFICLFSPFFLFFYCSQIHTNLRELILHLSPRKRSRERMREDRRLKEHKIIREQIYTLC